MVVILCGKSGSGKDAICKKLIESGYSPIISTTSRPKRDGEVDGVDYNFVDKDTFIQFIEHDFLIEYRSYNTLVDNIPDTWYYGILKQEFDLSKKDYVVILDIDGTREFKDYIERTNGSDYCKVFYIFASDDVRKLRAMNRGSFNETEWNRRLEADLVDFAVDRVDSVDATIINNNGLLSDSVAAIKELVTQSSIDKAIKAVNKGEQLIGGYFHGIEEEY